jgi:hypothetical protein
MDVRVGRHTSGTPLGLGGGSCVIRNDSYTEHFSRHSTVILYHKPRTRDITSFLYHFSIPCSYSRQSMLLWNIKIHHFQLKERLFLEIIKKNKLTIRIATKYLPEINFNIILQNTSFLPT